MPAFGQEQTSTDVPFIKIKSHILDIFRTLYKPLNSIHPLLTSTFNPAAQRARPLSNPASQRVSFETRYKRFRNELRKFSLDSILREVLRLTVEPPSDPVDALRQFPWLAMLIAKWALLDKMVLSNIGTSMSQARLQSLVQELWEFEQDLVKSPVSASVHLMIRPRIFSQGEFQRTRSKSFLRIPALLARLPAGHRLREIFTNHWQLTPEQFSDLAVSLYTPHLVEGKPGFHRDYFSPLAAIYGEKSIDRILGQFSRNIAGLRQELCESEANSDGKGIKPRRRSELLEFPYFKRFPLLRTAPDTYLVWNPLVLARAIEEAVHLRLSDAGEVYTKSFSKVFESYVVELAESAFPTVHNEDAIRSAGGSDKKVVEALIPFESCNVLIEAKMGLYRDDVMTLSDPEILSHKFRDLRKAVFQGATVVDSIDNGSIALQDVEQRSLNYLLVVTSRELNVGCGDILNSMCQPRVIEYPTEASRVRLPLEHVFYLSIDGFERICESVRVGSCDLPVYLANAVELNRNPMTASYWLDARLSNPKSDDNSISLISQAWKASYERLEAALCEKPQGLS